MTAHCICGVGLIWVQRLVLICQHGTLGLFAALTSRFARAHSLVVHCAYILLYLIFFVIFFVNVLRLSMTDNHSESDVETELVQFDFDEWAHNAGLSRKATAVLRQEDITTRRTLVLLKPCDVRSLNLQLGQTKLLEAAVNELNAMDKITTPVAAANDAEDVCAPVGLRTGYAATGMDGLTLNNLRQQAENISASGELLDNLLKDVTSPEKTSQNSRPTSETTSYSGFDPRVNLTVKSKNNKAVHITQFLSERSPKRRISKQKELVLSSATDSDQLSLVKLDDDHPYAGIFLSEWASANMRLMAHLRQIGCLPDDQTDYYLSYTVTILDFADSYTWSSILSFDHMYREMQAAHKFSYQSIQDAVDIIKPGSFLSVSG